jgi:hypothetical protein
MISLEQAEQEYNDYTTQLSVEEDPSIFEHPFPGMAASNEIVSETTYQQNGLFYIARMEINSMRSSLVRDLKRGESLQVQMMRHNQRLSLLIQDDHQILSKRWSTLLDPHADDFAGASSSRQSIHLDQPRNNLDSLAVGLEPVFVRFQEWFLCQPWSKQDKLLETLRANVLSDRHPGGYKLLDKRPKQSMDQSSALGEAKATSREHEDSMLTQLDPPQYKDDVQETTSKQRAPRLHLAPILLESRPFLHKQQIPTRPQITIQNTGTPSISQSSGKSGILEHRRSRSHDVPRSRDAGIPTRSAGNAYGHYEISSAGAEHEQSLSFEERIDTLFLEHMRQRDGSKSEIDLENKKMHESMGELLSPMSPRDGASRRPQSSLVRSTRREKGYSILFDPSPTAFEIIR